MAGVLRIDHTPDCVTAQSWMGLWLDGEISPEDGEALQTHLRACPACANQLALYSRTKDRLRQAETALPVPPALLAKVHAELNAHDAKTRRWPLAAGVAASVALALGGLWLARAGDAPAAARATPPAVVAESVAHHQRQLPVDIASPDPQRVAIYLARTLGQPLAVPQLDAQGFSLRGGRVVRLQDALAAQLVYQGPLGERLSVLAQPTPKGHQRTALAYAAQLGAYSVRVQPHDDAIYTVVSEGKDAIRIDAAAFH